MVRYLIIAGVSLITIAGCSKPERDRLPPENAANTPAELPPGVSASPAPTANVALKPTANHNSSGSLAVTADAGVVRLSGQLSGLVPNQEHGFHIHETGDCSAPDASSAGPHFNPTNQPHGQPDGSTHHAGDLFNVKADAQGVAMVDVRSSGLTLGDGAATDIMGRSVVVHAMPDDYFTQPSGASGDRIACGVIG